jgi:hypothetical protein
MIFLHCELAAVAGGVIVLAAVSWWLGKHDDEGGL